MAESSSSDETPTFFVAVHVGAGYQAPSNEKALRSAMKRACLAAAAVLTRDDPHTNAGRGSNLTEDGLVESDASIMDGESGAFGAVGAIPGVRNAIQLAASLLKDQLMESSVLGCIPPSFLVGEGARNWAKSKGIVAAKSKTEVDKWLRTRKTISHWQKYKAIIARMEEKATVLAAECSRIVQQDASPEPIAASG
ncbi:putative threonine aspartase [Drosera capensis]